MSHTAKERIIELLQMPQLKEDKNALQLINEVLSAALRYVSAVYTMDTSLCIKRLTASTSEIQELSSRLDQNRTIAHNALIDSIRICNRYLFNLRFVIAIPAGGVYSKDPSHLSNDALRAYIGDWAEELVSQFFKERKR